jgi:hypothetical protein
MNKGVVEPSSGQNGMIELAAIEVRTAWERVELIDIGGVKRSRAKMAPCGDIHRAGDH